MDINWSMLDGALGVVLLIVVVWAALKLVTRLVLALVLIVLVAILFVALHSGELGLFG